MAANIGAELQQLPLEYMLAGPLTAVIKAQALAAKTTLEFIENVGLEPDGTTGDLKARTAEFSYSQPVPDPNTPGAVLPIDTKLSVPLLAIVPVPYIRASDLNVSFEFKIRDVQSAESKSQVTGTTTFTSTTTGSGKYGGGLAGLFGAPSGTLEQKTEVSFNVSATYQATNRQMTDRSATFKMTMNAVQDAVPEGLARVLSILSDAIKGTKK